MSFQLSGDVMVHMHLFVFHRHMPVLGHVLQDKPTQSLLIINLTPCEPMTRQKAIDHGVMGKVVHIRFHLEIQHFVIGHKGMVHVIHEANLRLLGQFRATQEVAMCFVVRCPTHFHASVTDFKSGNDLIKQNPTAHTVLQVALDFFCPIARALIVGEYHNVTAAFRCFPLFQVSQHLQNARPQEFGIQIQNFVEVVLGEPSVIRGQCFPEHSVFDEIPQRLV